MSNNTWKVYLGDEEKGILNLFRILHLVQDLLENNTKKVIQLTLINNSDNLFSECRYKNIQELLSAINDMPESMYNSKSTSEKSLMTALGKLSPNYSWVIYQSLHKFIDSFLF